MGRLIQLDYIFYKKIIEYGIVEGYTVEFIRNVNYTYPRVSIDKKNNKLVIYNQDEQTVCRLKEALSHNQS
ncbi:hypothetical protein D3C71_1312500 [compost metagenome]